MSKRSIKPMTNKTDRRVRVLTPREPEIDAKLIDTVWAAVWAATPEQEAELWETFRQSDAQAKLAREEEAERRRNQHGRKRVGVFRKISKVRTVGVDELDPKHKARVERIRKFVELSLRPLREPDVKEPEPEKGKVVKFGIAKRRTKYQVDVEYIARVCGIGMLSGPSHIGKRRTGENDDARDEL